MIILLFSGGGLALALTIWWLLFHSRTGRKPNDMWDTDREYSRKYDGKITIVRKRNED